VTLLNGDKELVGNCSVADVIDESTVQDQKNIYSAISSKSLPLADRSGPHSAAAAGASRLSPAAEGGLEGDRLREAAEGGDSWKKSWLVGGLEHEFYFSIIYGYGSIPIHTIFRRMNIHLPAILMFTRGIGF